MSANYLKSLWKSSVMILFLCLGLSSWAQTDVLGCPVGTIENDEMVFTTDNFTVTHAKGSDANFAAYSPWRVYTNNTVTFSGGENVQKITSVVITAGSNSYATAAVGANSVLTVLSGTGTVSGVADASTVTLTVTGDDVSEISLKPHAQTRWNSITINYELAAVTGDHTITVTQPIGGDITPGTSGVEDGGSVSFTATPESVCYTFSHWMVDGANAGSANPYDFTNVTADHTITAVFTATGTYEIVATAGANGSISPNGTSVINCGEDQTYTIIPNVGYTIADVLVNGVSVGAIATYTFENVTENQTITVSFVEYEAPDYYDGIGVFEKITSLSGLTEGYYVVVESHTNANAMTNNHNGTFLAREAVTPVGDNTITNPNTGIVWYIAADGGGYTIYNEVTEKYVSYTGSSNNIQVVDAVAGNNQRWTITYTDDEFHITNIELDTRKLQYNSNNGQERFAAYTGSQKNLFLYKLSAPSTDPIFAVAPASITGLNYGLGNGPSAAQSFVLSGNNL